MKLNTITTLIASSAVMTLSANAASMIVSDLQIRSGGMPPLGIFGVAALAPSGVTFNGGTPAVISNDPIDVMLTLNNLDLDGDSTANDSVTFTITATGTNGATPRVFNQGFDSGFGNLNGISFAVTSVSGNATDSGDLIVFDGFTGASASAGRGTGPAAMPNPSTISAGVDINGQRVVLTGADTMAFQFLTESIDFAAPTSTVVFNNSSIDEDGTGTGDGTIVARAFDLQFSTTPTPIPEPSSTLLIGLAGCFMVVRRRR